MDKNKSIFISLIILALLVVIRLSVIIYPDDVSTIIMSAINFLALDIVIIIIYYRAYKKMVKVHTKVCEEKQISVHLNQCIKRFGSQICLISIILLVVSAIYVIFFRNGVFNDILTITSLVLSIEDDIFIGKLIERNYTYS